LKPTPCQNLNGKFQTLTGAFAEILNNMVDLDRFDLDGVTMRINRLETQGKQLFSGTPRLSVSQATRTKGRSGVRGQKEEGRWGEGRATPCSKALVLSQTKTMFMLYPLSSPTPRPLNLVRQRGPCTRLAPLTLSYAQSLHSRSQQVFSIKEVATIDQYGCSKSLWIVDFETAASLSSTNASQASVALDQFH